MHPFNGLFSRTTWVSRYQKGKTSLDLDDARDDGVWGCSGISWTICKQSAPCSRWITTPTPHHSFSTGRMLFLTPNQQRQLKRDIYVKEHKYACKNWSTDPDFSRHGLSFSKHVRASRHVFRLCLAVCWQSAQVHDLHPCDVIGVAVDVIWEPFELLQPRTYK